MNENQEMSKSHLRKLYKKILSNLSPQYQINSVFKVNTKLCKKIRNQKIIEEKNKYVMSFIKIPDQNEIDLNFINNMLSHQNHLVLPRVNTETNNLDVYFVNDLKTLVPQPPYNILEPDPNVHKLISPEEIHTILVPGLAFDRQNNRLGRGKGYYDRFLKTVPDCTRKIGVGFLEQYCPIVLPTNDHDVKVDEVILPNT